MILEQKTKPVLQQNEYFSESPLKHLKLQALHFKFLCLKTVKYQSEIRLKSAQICDSKTTFLMPRDINSIHYCASKVVLRAEAK